MANTKSQWVNGNKPMPLPNGSEVVNVPCAVEVAAANLALNDLIILGEIPEDCAFVDAVYGLDDLDSNGAPALALSFGIVNAAEDDLETVFQAGITTGQAGGALRATLTQAMLEYTTPSNAGKRFGFKVTTAAATGQAGTARCSISYRAQAHGE